MIDIFGFGLSGNNESLINNGLRLDRPDNNIMLGFSQRLLNTDHNILESIQVVILSEVIGLAFDDGFCYVLVDVVACGEVRVGRIGVFYGVVVVLSLSLLLFAGRRLYWVY